MQIYTQIHPFNSDQYTPVGLYNQLRNHYRKPCLLESNDYHDRTESKSIIGLDPILEFVAGKEHFQVLTENDTPIFELHSSNPKELGEHIQEQLNKITFHSNAQPNGFFGRFGFEFARIKETHVPQAFPALQLPDLHLFVFRYLIVIDHFTDEGFILKNDLQPFSKLDALEVQQLLQPRSVVDLPFNLSSQEQEQFSEEEFKQMVVTGIEHCKQGDVFQLVLSNSYRQEYFGDDFQVYRTLRRLNPSPYLFYFDFETYRLMGSSPEAQLKVEHGIAEIHPIAGTVKRTGETIEDETAITFLLEDEKEQAEHTMLVDLARNDLSKHSKQVKVETYKEVQRFSHVFHLVSKVTGKVEEVNYLELFAGTFPAGTLSGTPKPKALELIATYEKVAREYYGGAIGFFLPGHTLHTAIVIRSILAKNGILHYRAGAGIVLDSKPDLEYQEVQNKLRAVRTAIQKTHNEKTKQHETSRY